MHTRKMTTDASERIKSNQECEELNKAINDAKIKERIQQDKIVEQKREIAQILGLPN